MIELFSNFILIPITKYTRSEKDWTDFRVFIIDDNNVEDMVKISIEEYKNLKNILIVYKDYEIIQYFLSIFTYYEGNIKKKREFEDLMIRNGCVFIN